MIFALSNYRTQLLIDRVYVNGVSSRAVKRPAATIILVIGAV